MPDAIAWVDEVAPDRAVGVCGAKMGRLAELLRAGISLPKGFTVTVEAYRQHWAQAGLDEVVEEMLGRLGADAGPAEVEAAAAAVRAEGAPREMSAAPAPPIPHPSATLAPRRSPITPP